MNKNKIIIGFIIVACSFFLLWKTNILSNIFTNNTNNKIDEKKDVNDKKPKEAMSNDNKSTPEDNSKDANNDNINSDNKDEKNSKSTNYVDENKENPTDKKDTLGNKSNSNSDNSKNIVEKNILNINYQTQKEWNYCAPTAVSMMLSAKGKLVDQYTLAKEMGTYEPFGTHNKDAVRVLNKYMFGYEYPQGNQAGYHLEFVTNVSQETLDLFKTRVIKNIKDGYPIYLTFDASKIYPGKKGEHNTILVGYKIENNNFFIYYLDPSPAVYDNVYGGLKILSSEELLNAMLTCEEPNYAW